MTTRLQLTDKKAWQLWYINNKNVPQKKHCLGTVSKKYFYLEGLNYFHGANLTLSSDVAQDT